MSALSPMPQDRPNSIEAKTDRNITIKTEPEGSENEE